MLNAKDTLKKIADALNVATEEPKVEETVETTEPVTDAQETEKVEETTEVATETETTEEPKEEAKEPKEEVKEVEVKEDVKEEFEPQNERLRELEAQIESLKDILANSFVKESESKEQAPEIPAEEPKGLTHSPEKTVAPKANGIGKKGGDIKSRVWKYINNN